MTIEPSPGPRALTFTERVLRRAEVAPGPEGSRCFWAEPDLLLAHEATFALLLDRLERRKWAVRDPSRCLFAADHFSPPATAERASILRRYLDFLEERGLPQQQLFEGISHQLMLEDGRCGPGLFIAGADSHTTMAGALGAVACGFGSTDMLVAFAWGRVLVQVPEVELLRLRGAPSAVLGSRDLALALMQIYGQGGLAWRSLEVHDLGDEGLPLSWRASLCNQGVDAGAKSSIFLPDAAMAAQLEARDGSAWPAFVPESPAPDDAYRRVEELDLSQLEPLAAQPNDPSDIVKVRELEPLRIHQAFVGSCAGGRYEDLVEAAEVLRGRKVAPGVRLVVTPASRKVWLEAARSGIAAELVEAGALMTDSSCGACGGIDKGLLGAGERAVGTTNRNFRGRMGHPDAQLWLASARTAAASAVTGRLTDPRELLS